MIGMIDGMISELESDQVNLLQFEIDEQWKALN